MESQFLTVRDKHLSLWQSVVSETTRRSSEIAPELGVVMREAAGRHAQASVKGRPILRPASLLEAPLSIETQTYLSKVHFEAAQTWVGMRSDDPRSFGHWSYSDSDVNWVQCLIAYKAYYGTIPGAQPKYNDWTIAGEKNPNYGVLDYKLPNDARVLLLGDWGTGQNDAVTMLTAALIDLKPDVVLHLGDVYYSGTPWECQSNIVDVFKSVFSNPKTNRVPIFMIPGNHEYYSGGFGFYATIQVLNASLNGCLQDASYFALRTADQIWQFLAMDTGIGDHNPYMDAIAGAGLNQFARGPALLPSEVSWHVDKLENFPGNTVLLSHHQLFSANARINGSWTGDTAFLNKRLFNTFQPYFNRVSAWFWGHEHNFAPYQNGLFGLNMARLLGNSAYEETKDDDPYKVNYPAIPYAGNIKKST